MPMIDDMIDEDNDILMSGNIPPNMFSNNIYFFFPCLFYRFFYQTINKIKILIRTMFVL